MNQIKILGWVLLPFNIIGLWFCIYNLQGEISIGYLLGIVLFVAQISYLVKTLQVLNQFEIGRRMLESAVKKAALGMAKILKGKRGEKEG